MPQLTPHSIRKLSIARKEPETIWVPDPGLFNLEVLNTPEGLDNAVTHLLTTVFSSGQAGAALGAAVTALLDLDACVLPLILSYDETLNEQILERLEATFPRDAVEYSGSTASRVLDSLQSFFFSIPPLEDETKLDRVHHELRKATAILNATFDHVPGASLSAKSPTSPLAAEDHEIPFLVKKHRRKRSSVVSRPPTGNGISDENGRNMSDDVQDASQRQKAALDEIKEILKRYMGSLACCHQSARDIVSARLKSRSSMVSRKVKGETSATTNEATTLSPTTIESVPYITFKSIQFIEEDIKDFGPWRILLSGESMRHLRQIGRADRHTFDIVRNKMQQLSIGFFSESNQKRLVGKETEVPIFEAKMTRDTRLVYTIACVPDDTGKHEIQAIKMFGVFTHAQINSRLWAAVAAWSTRRGAEYRKRCLARQASKQNTDYVVPCSWPPLQESYDTNVEIDKDISLELHALLTHEKFVPLNQAVLTSLLADEEATHPFSVSHREHEIIYHPSSCFVIGRSGTGKTTTMMYKMLAVEKTARVASQKVRQVFITQSKVLAEKVEESFSNMVQSYAGHLLSAEERQWRAMMKKHADKHLVELDAEDDSFSNLPSHFSKLEDKHFPLFLTFDKLCKMMEADYKSTLATPRSPTVNFQSTQPTSPTTTLESPTRLKHNYRTTKGQLKYEDFHSRYWGSFPQPLTKGLDSALVWNEIQGVIRGSELSLQAPGGAVDRSSYESDIVSFRKQAAFARHRPRLYDIFELYIKRKTENWDRDAADRTHSLLQYVQSGALKPEFDYIYVDEVQDNLLIDSKLLRFLCRNPCGMFWAGDTAQQITSTAFRFSDLKAFLYRIEEADTSVQAGKRPSIQPKEFTLSINYRSHGGIINCARSVIQLLMTLWRDSIDALDPEQGLVDGPKPMFFSGWDRDLVHYEQFLFGEESNRMEFGAEQCILVRNDTAREELRSQIGDFGLIMTLYESKGLEFNDVLLYNFFENSVVEAEWRVVLNAVEKKKRGNLSIPTFNELRHLGVCSELKFLYVGLTRARNHLWIWDSSPAAEYMKTVWESQSLIDIKRPGDPVPRLAVSSSAEEWEKMGKLMFARENYQQAIVCFERAKKPLEASISNAYHLRKTARLLQEGSSSRKEGFTAAANAFYHCASGDHPQSQTCCLNAGKCYAEAGRDSEASKAYCLGGDFTKGAKHARMAGEFDRALRIIQDPTNAVDNTVASAIIEVCKVIYVREESYSKARDLFQDEDELLQHVEDCGFDKTAILVELDRLQEAAENQIKNGLTIEAIELLLRANTEDSVSSAATLLLDDLWLALPYNFGITPQNQTRVHKLLELSNSVAHAPHSWKQEINMFYAISQDNKWVLERLANEFFMANKALPALRCTYHLLNKDADLKGLSLAEMDHYLVILHIFGASLRSLLCKAPHEIVQGPEIRRLLAYIIVEESSGREAIIRGSSPLHQLFSNANEDGYVFYYLRRGEGDELFVSWTELEKAVWILLNGDLRRCLENHDSKSRAAHAFKSFCVANVAERCRYGNSCSFLHVSSDAMKQVFNERFRMYLGQILVINDMDVTLDHEARVRIRMYWMSRFVDVVYPQYTGAGKLADLIVDASNSERRISEGLVVLRQWIRESIYKLNLSNSPRVLEIFLISSALDHYGVPQYIHRTRLWSKVPLEGYRFDKITGRRRVVYLDLYNGLFAHGDAAMRAGVDYLHHVIESRTPLNANVLVSMLEVVTAQLLAGLKPDLHDLYIPQSWLFVLGQRLVWPRTRELHFAQHLLVPLIALSHEINSGCHHLTLDYKPIRDVGRLSRRNLIERIFRCLILVGCNAGPGNTVSIQILRSITRVAGGADLNETCWPNWYVQAISWDTLVGAAVRSLSRSQTDNIIQLVKAGSYNVSSIRGVAQREFESSQNLFYEFIKSPLVQMPQRLKAPQTAGALVSMTPLTATPVDGKHLANLKSVSTGQNNEASTPKPSDGTQDRYFTESIEEDHLEYSYTEEEISAVLVIKGAWKRYRRKHSEVSPRYIPDKFTLDKWFKLFDALRDISQVSRYYLAILRGPLPHLMICLDAYRTEIAKQKSHAKKYLTGDHRSIEDALARMSEINLSNRFVHDSIRRVGPGSPLHNEGDEAVKLKVLRNTIEETAHRMEAILQQRLDIRSHFNLAYKGIVREPVKKVVMREPRPTLNISDLYE